MLYFRQLIDQGVRVLFDNDDSLKTVVRGGVVMPDPAQLQRPFSMPGRTRRTVAAIVVAAAVVAALMAWGFFHAFAAHDAQQAESVQQVLNRGVSLDLPVLSDYAGMDADQVRQALAQRKVATVDLASVSGSDDTSLDLVKIPSDVSATDALAALQQGVSSLSGADAARLLSGSWRLTMSAGDGVDMRLRFADFSDATPKDAVQSVVASQGLSSTTLGDSGVDSAGNDYQSGTFTAVDGTVYSWTVSACPLSNVYSNDGLPATASYVGVHITG